MSQSSQGIVRDGKGEEQPADAERARKAVMTKPGRFPAQQIQKEEAAPRKSDKPA